MPDQTAVKEIAYYFPNPMWRHGDWMKSLIVFFDGVALLVPEYMKDKPELIDPAIVGGLNEHNFLVGRGAHEIALRFCCCNGAGVAGRNATVTKPYMLGHSSSLAQLSRYLRQILGFIGIEDFQTVRAEGTNIPPLAIHAVPNREKAVAALVI